ncbi:nitroreductase family protein [Lentilactobacillus otakiensis]|uniref:Nitroreductase n=1 Tax=Lentilactobacillus otakiensis DSM 19908 = JCM 15040 TaxID=1423780 RepID=S4NFR8_9LACO|nr:nitroreductase family protein [Lentilactobacillus otakiensis]KRL08937.1 nitroreductase [Lentilactobacillus otakiensis DSM 19908 = JCM 15040]MBZ3775550.1 nitroreductase family protein [Lentilactobacillus otakiensis]MDV3518770.1 nitroreductase family protein [Lentilactobacillus otakiensis]GAD16072.1 nitroreductase [Lentilactobacillus otakiensis DSM 19908 = JCM 15040]
METLKMIQSRKAIREYSGQVSDDQLHEILVAANASPVGMGRYDDYRLTVIQDPAVLSKMTGIYEAPTVIVVSIKDDSASDEVSAGAIVHNMELAAEDQGLGANYNMASLGSIPSEVIPDGFKPAFALTLGQTSDEFTPREIPLDRIKTNMVK